MKTFATALYCAAFVIMLIGLTAIVAHGQQRQIVGYQWQPVRGVMRGAFTRTPVYGYAKPVARPQATYGVQQSYYQQNYYAAPQASYAMPATAYGVPMQAAMEAQLSVGLEPGAFIVPGSIQWSDAIVVPAMPYAVPYVPPLQGWGP